LLKFIHRSNSGPDRRPNLAKSRTEEDQSGPVSERKLHRPRGEWFETFKVGLIDGGDMSFKAFFSLKRDVEVFEHVGE